MKLRIPPRLMLALIASAIAGCGTVARSGSTRQIRGPSRGDELLAEAEAFFTFHGARIHPLLVQEFEGWLSDGGPVTLSVDVNAAEGTDEYGAPVKLDGNEILSDIPNAQPGQRYGYERIGVLRDGTQVVKTSDYGGGTGVFQSLMFLRFKLQEHRRFNGQVEKRLVLSVVDAYPLGDRDRRVLQVLPDRVVVPSHENRADGMVLIIPNRAS
jgi:hypothetical protein